MKSGKGGVWTLRDTRVNAMPTQLGAVKVTLLRSDGSGAPSRQVVRFLAIGETQELECAQGKLTVNYQIVGQE